ncbi:MAG: hypothetical protein JOZ72_08690 [Alphaproteobacteria bacterium]|nr:hypothetical protein [Alphaproteobacteria bacterium]
MTADWGILAYIVAIATTIVVMGAAFVVFWLILWGKIDLSQMLTESDMTKASLSRFQFLIFTFVVAGLFLLLSVEAGTFVNIPASVLSLLGISAGSYAVSKGIQANNTPENAALAAAKQAAAAKQQADIAKEHAEIAAAAAAKTGG